LAAFAVVVALDIDDFEIVVRFETQGGTPHHTQQIVLHARLIDDDVRKLRQTCFGILNAAGTPDRAAIFGIGPPESRFVDPVRLALQAIAQAERIEHLDGAARDAVRLAHQERSGTALDDARIDRRKLRELRGQHESRRPAADDQDIDRFGHVDARRVAGGRFDRRIADAETVEMKLHGVSLFDWMSRWPEIYSVHQLYQSDSDELDVYP
jgi:hypothetical protein